MIVLGIDPGIGTTGYGVVREDEHGEAVLIFGHFADKSGHAGVDDAAQSEEQAGNEQKHHQQRDHIRHALTAQIQHDGFEDVGQEHRQHQRQQHRLHEYQHRTQRDQREYSEKHRGNVLFLVRHDCIHRSDTAT